MSTTRDEARQQLDEAQQACAIVRTLADSAINLKRDNGWYGDGESATTEAEDLAAVAYVLGAEGKRVEEPEVIQTSCDYCGQDIEGIKPFPYGEWRDRGSNTTCPTPEGDAGRKHEPIDDPAKRVNCWACGGSLFKSEAKQLGRKFFCDEECLDAQRNAEPEEAPEDSPSLEDTTF